MTQTQWDINMTLKELLQALADPDHTDVDVAMEMDVEFCTLKSADLSLLSVYEHCGKIIIDIGTDNGN